MDLSFSFKIYAQPVDAVRLFHKSANGIIGDGISDKIKIEILSSTPGITGNKRSLKNNTFENYTYIYEMYAKDDNWIPCSPGIQQQARTENSP